MTAAPPKEEKTKPHKHRVNKADQSKTTPLIEVVNNDLIAPLKGDPFTVRIDRTENIRARDAAVLDHGSPRRDMPKHVDVPDDPIHDQDQEAKHSQQNNRLPPPRWMVPGACGI